MNKKPTLTLHAKERVLKRVMEVDGPYSESQLRAVSVWLHKNMVEHPLYGRWILTGFENMRLVVKDGYLVTIKFPEEFDYDNMQKGNDNNASDSKCSREWSKRKQRSKRR